MPHYIKRLLALVLTVSLLLCAVLPISAQSAHSFSDISGIWSEEYIKAAVQVGFVRGISQTQFSPDATLTRAMFVTMLWRIAQEPDCNDTHRFADVPAAAYYSCAVRWAHEGQIVRGVSQTRFDPDAAITREQMCAILYRYAASVQQLLPTVNDRVSFADGSRIASWAVQAVDTLQQAGLVSGVGGNRFSPQGGATRAEAATLLVRYLRASGKIDFNWNLFDPNQELSYAELLLALDRLQDAYPKLIRVQSAGISYEGRDIPMVLFGTGSRYLYFEANIHAREHLSTNYLLEVLDTYAFYVQSGNAYGGYDLRTLLSAFTLVLLPRVNPDGANLVQNGFEATADAASLRAMQGAWRGAGQWKANAQGIDINRNFPIGWGIQEFSSPAYAYFCGNTAAQAPETKAVMAAMSAYPYEAFFDMHMNGNCIYYANTTADAAYAASRTLAQKLCALSGYTLEPPDDISGCMADWGRQYYQKPTLTVELWPSGTFPADAAAFNTKIWAKAKYLPAAIMESFFKA